MTKIDIFSGFLGAGKTTLIKKLIKEAYAGEKVVLIENEFGEIGIDGGFLQDAGIEITEMNSGCICCSLVGDFSKALSKVLEEYEPDRVIIEPSGVGKLSDVIKAVKGVETENARLNTYTTVVDAGKCKMYMKNFGEFFGDQIKNASAVVFSHTDVAKSHKIEEAVEIVRENNPDAVIITAPLADIDGKDILAAMEHSNTIEKELSDLVREHHHHEHHHHEHDEDCKCGCHDHEHEHHHHEHDEDCKCGCHDHEHEHHHHEHDEDCECGCHDHEHHHHEHDEDCECGCHDHEHHHHEHGEDCKCGCHDHEHHHADEVFASLGAETPKKFTEDKITAILEAFDEDDDYGMILRAKGIVMAEDGRWIHFDYVPGEPNVRYGTASVTGRICVIGSKIKKEKIKELFGI